MPPCTAEKVSAHDMQGSSLWLQAEALAGHGRRCSTGWSRMLAGKSFFTS